MFVAFLNLRIEGKRSSAVITLVAGASFGVYLIHDHYYIREALWTKIDGALWLDKWYLLPASLGTIFAVYGVCTLIELLRQRLFFPLDNSARIRGWFLRLDEKIRTFWNDEEGSKRDCRR